MSSSAHGDLVLHIETWYCIRSRNTQTKRLFLLECSEAHPQPHVDSNGTSPTQSGPSGINRLGKRTSEGCSWSLACSPQTALSQSRMSSPLRALEPWLDLCLPSPQQAIRQVSPGCWHDRQGMSGPTQQNRQKSTRAIPALHQKWQKKLSTCKQTTLWLG